QRLTLAWATISRQGRKAFGGHEPAQRPYRRAAHQRRGIVQQLDSLRCKRRIAGIADRDQHIAHEPVATRALDRRLRKHLSERRVVETGEIGEPRNRQFLTRGEFALAAGLREFVPGAYRETIVATEDAIADRAAKLPRNRSLVLDGEVGDAAARIESVGRRKGGGRAHV